MFRIIYHDFSSNAFHFWLYIDGHPLQAKKFVANFEIMNDKKEAVMSGNNEGIPWDIQVAQVKFKRILKKIVLITVATMSRESSICLKIDANFESL